LAESLWIRLHIAERCVDVVKEETQLRQLRFLEICTVLLKRAEALLKDIKAGKCPGVLRLRRKLPQAARFMHRALTQSKFHQGTHLDVKALVVWGIVVSAALIIEMEK